MVIPSQPRKASWLSDLLRHRTAKEAPLEFVRESSFNMTRGGMKILKLEA